jgi:hypothetical protein
MILKLGSQVRSLTHRLFARREVGVHENRVLESRVVARQ